jgi:hypothetical protein
MSAYGRDQPLARRIFEVRPTHNNQIKKEALRAPIIQGVMFTRSSYEISHENGLCNKFGIQIV